MDRNNSKLVQDFKVLASRGQNVAAEFRTTSFAEGLKVDYAIRLSFSRPASGPLLFQHDIERIVFESLSAFLKDLESELQKP